MTRPILIGIGGKLRSGKDTVADYLVAHHDFVKLGMSDPLADALYTLNPIICEPFEDEQPNDMEGMLWRYQDIVDERGYTEAKKIPEVRRLLQVLGTEVGRNLIGNNVWVDIAASRAQAAMNEGHNVILTGIRFQNELDMIEQQPTGHSVYVTRPGNDQYTSPHASENGVEAYMFETVIENDSTLDELYESARELYQGLLALQDAAHELNGWHPSKIREGTISMDRIVEGSLWPKYDH